LLLMLLLLLLLLLLLSGRYWQTTVSGGGGCTCITMLLLLREIVAGCDCTASTGPRVRRLGNSTQRPSRYSTPPPPTRPFGNFLLSVTREPNSLDACYHRRRDAPIRSAALAKLLPAATPLDHLEPSQIRSAARATFCFPLPHAGVHDMFHHPSPMER
ncbi:hypothetical protein X777_06310, partial [Ooceraea biroi]